MGIRMAFLALLMMVAGCTSGRLIRDDPHNEIVPAGTERVIDTTFDPAMHAFIRGLKFGRFDDRECTYSGYYCPGIGVQIARKMLGTIDLGHTTAHEILHAVYTHGYVDESAFSEAVDRLMCDKHFETFVEPVNSNRLWTSIVYTLFEENEYYARIGEEIVERHGINVPAYLWPFYRGILHPNLEYTSRQYSRPPFSAQADLIYRHDGEEEVVQGALLQHGLRQPAVHDAALPRLANLELLRFRVFMSHPGTTTQHILLFRRRSTGELVVSFNASPDFSPADGPNYLVLLNAEQVFLLLTAWQEHDLDIQVIDPYLAALLHR